MDKVDSAAILDGMRRRGEFLVSTLLWAGAAGFACVAAGYVAFFYYHMLSVADRARTSLGFHAPAAGPDWFALAVIAVPVVVALILLAELWVWYRRVWGGRLKAVWGDDQRHAAWSEGRESRAAWLQALLATPAWSGAKIDANASYPDKARAAFHSIEQDILERAFTTGLVAGVSRNRWVDTVSIVAAAAELQLHVLTRLGKRPSWSAWKLLIQRCGASLFVNTYLTRQDAMLVTIAVKKAGIGLQAAGDAMDAAANYITESDVDLDDLLHLNRLEGVPLAGLATKSLEVAATMTLTVGKQGMYALGHLVEAAGDDLAQGAIAAAILYHHGVALAADTLALDAEHRRAPEFNPGFATGLARMTALAGNILLDAVRQLRAAFRERRAVLVKHLPRAAAEGIKGKLSGLFGKKSGEPAAS